MRMRRSKGNISLQTPLQTETGDAAGRNASQDRHDWHDSRRHQTQIY